MGQSPASSSYNNNGSGLPFFQGNADFGDVSPLATTWCSNPKKIAEPGDILLSVRAPIGAVNIAKEKCCIGRGIAAIRPSSHNISCGFLWHLLLANRKKFETLGTGSTFKAIGKRVLSDYEFMFYDMSKQNEISEQLDLIIRAIRKVEQQNILLGQLIKSRFVEMFGTPENRPAGFEIKTLESVCSSIVRGPFGSALKKEIFVPKSTDSFKVYEQKNAIQKDATIGTYYITKDIFDSLRRFECAPGDIIMSCSGTMGRLYQLPPESERGVINQALCKFTLNESILSEYFFEFMGQVIDELGAKGSSIKNVSSVKYIKQIKVPVPPFAIQQQYADFVGQVDKSRFALLCM